MTIENMCECDDCGHKCHVDDLDRVTDYFTRIDQGNLEAPAGQCPECGALSYFDGEETNKLRRKRNAAEELYETVKHLAWFIENVSDDDPNRTDKFFVAREMWRKALRHATQ